MNRRVRINIVVAMALAIVPASAALADDEPICRAVVPISQVPDFGEYGYGHKELHEFGSIQELIKKENKTCCDGGAGGECRMTAIRWQSPKSLFKHGSVWCEFNSEIIRTDVKLPPGTEAIVCAPKAAPGSCPLNVWCASVRLDG